MDKKLRKRKIKALFKVSSRNDDNSFEDYDPSDDEFSEEDVASKKDMPLISNFQCNRHSAAWIDPNGEIHYIPNESYYNFDEDREEIFPMYDHSNYIFKVLLKDKEGDPSRNYMDWLNKDGKVWVKVSNYKELSIDSGIPTQKQFNSFGKIHIQCLEKTSSGFLSPDNDIITFIINGGLSKEKLRSNMHLFNVKDRPDNYKKIDIQNHNIYDSVKVLIKAHEFFSTYCPDLEEEYYNKLMEI